MTVAEVLALHPGDEVYWNDPADGECSKYVTIQEIRVQGADEPDAEIGSDAVISIVGKDGCNLECFMHELS